MLDPTRILVASGISCSNEALAVLDQIDQIDFPCLEITMNKIARILFPNLSRRRNNIKYVFSSEYESLNQSLTQKFILLSLISSSLNLLGMGGGSSGPEWQETPF